jgi:D-threo-aldose 1-dehydrogenase
MNTRRDFLSIAVKGSAAAATTLLPKAASASGVADLAEGSSTEQTTSNGHYKPPFKFAMGGVPLGNEFEFVTDEDAYATIEAAWNAGVRYFDMAPWYGLGLAERRYGNFLHQQKIQRIRSLDQSWQTTQSLEDSEDQGVLPFFSFAERCGL